MWSECDAGVKVTVRVLPAYAPQQSRRNEERDNFHEDLNGELGQAGPEKVCGVAVRFEWTYGSRC